MRAVRDWLAFVWWKVYFDFLTLRAIVLDAEARRTAWTSGWFVIVPKWEEDKTLSVGQVRAMCSALGIDYQEFIRDIQAEEAT